jgi:hypothetical protein
MQTVSSQGGSHPRHSMSSSLELCAKILALSHGPFRYKPAAPAGFDEGPLRRMGLDSLRRAGRASRANIYNWPLRAIHLSSTACLFL